jgi:glycine/D-amino acid oxidase-like deaminating enzyme
MRAKLKVAVIGAGAFGGWTALHLLRSGANVTLIDAWGAGNPRSSSGGETRIFRGTYGPDPPYTEMTARAFRLWNSHQRKWKRQLLFPIGVLFLAKHGDDAWESGSIPRLKDNGIAHTKMSLTAMKRRWPQINFLGIDWGLFEPEGGYLTARAACQAVVEGFSAEGGVFQQAVVNSEGLEFECSKGLRLSDGTRLKADRYIFACGPWMGSLFPHAIGDRIRATKQDVFFFGTPPGDDRFSERHLPVWADHRGRFMYGIPGHGARAFKVADDTRGPLFDPTWGERIADAERLKAVREYVAFRFPAMKDAPLIKGRVCQYEQTKDGDFIVDRHPQQPGVWLVGGGSGHGFKHGPALGEMVARLVTKDTAVNAHFRLARFS